MVPSFLPGQLRHLPLLLLHVLRHPLLLPLLALLLPPHRPCRPQLPPR